MRTRLIKPDFWKSPDMTALSWDARLLFIGLWSYVDDNGVGIADMGLIVGELFATDFYKNPSEVSVRLSRAFHEILGNGLIMCYEAENRPYFYITSWSKHQTLQHPCKPRFPLPDGTVRHPKKGEILRISEDSGNPHESFSNPHETFKKSSPSNSNSNSNLFTPFFSPKGEPTPKPAKTPKASDRGTRIPSDFTITDTMRTWAAAKVPDLDVDSETERFIDYWKSVPGAKARKLDWAAVWRNWMSRAAKEARPRVGYRNQDTIWATAKARALAADQAQGVPLQVIGGGAA